MAEESFGDWLKHRRLGLGLTQDELALRINCSTSALRKFESEERRPSAETIDLLADIFNIPPEERRSFLRYARGDWLASPASSPDHAPWRPAISGLSSNLPSLLSSFIGREKEQWEVISLLKKNRLVTLAGAGGMGKTRLAIQVGHQLLHAYPHGVWFVPLDSLSDPLRVPQTVAAAFGLQESHDRQALETLMAVLREKTALLILDNCEHLLDASARLARTLLTHCPNLRILATSRELLKVEGEAVCYLKSLSTPKASDPFEKIAETESIQLFEARAALALSTFQLSKENAHAAADICRRLDGIPLAIELIVARVNILSVEEISKQLGKSFAILESKQRPSPSRHQTLRACMDWGWASLTDEEQVFLRRLSVFAGGWTLDAAQAVCAGDALELTNSLAQKSLIAVEPEPERATRYQFHEFLRQYAREKLAESGELEAVSDRHLEYFFHLSGKIEPGLHGPEQEEWYARAVDERDNLNAAMEQAAKKDVQTGLLLSSQLQDLWINCDVRAGAFWLNEFLQRPEANQYPLARARALCAQGWILLWLEKFAQGRGPAEECLALYQSCNDRTGEIDALCLLGTALFYVGDRAEGIKHFQRALMIAQSLEDIWRQAKIYSLMAEEQGYFHSPLDYWEKAVKLFGKAGDRRAQAEVLCSTSNYQVLNGDIELAQKNMKEAAALISLEKNLDILGYLLVEKSLIASSQGDYDGAYALLQEAFNQFDKLGNQIQCLWISVRFGYNALARGHTREAREIFARSAEAFQANKDTFGVIFSLEGMAGVLVFSGNPEAAARLLGWADALRIEANELRPRVEQKDVDKVIAACISSLGEIPFREAYQKGRGMTLNDAVEQALLSAAECSAWEGGSDQPTVFDDI